MKYLYFLSFAVFFGFPASSPAQFLGHHRAIEISERYFEEGQYAKALDNIDRKILQIGNSDKGFLVSEMLMYRVKYLEALGLFADFEAEVEKVLNIKKNAGEESLVYGKAVLDIAGFYLDYSDIKTAQFYYTQAQKILALDHDSKVAEDVSETEIEDLYFKSKSSEVAFGIHLARGEFDKAKEAVEEMIAVREKRMVDRELFFEAVTNSYKNRNLDRFKRNRRKNEYADALIMNGKLERLRGDYTLSDSLLDFSETWINENIKTKELAYIKNRYEQMILKFDEGKDLSFAKKELEKLIFLAEKKLGMVHQVYLDLHESLIDYYISSRYFRKSRIQRWELGVNTSRYYGSESTPHAVSIRLDAKKEFYDKDYEQSYEMLTDLFSKRDKLPDNHMERVRVADQLYKVALANDRYEEAREFLMEKMRLQNKILGENSLGYFETTMQLAGYYINFTSKFDTAKLLLGDGFDDVIKKRLLRTHKAYPEYLQEYADYFETIGNYDSALVLTQEIVTINEEKFGKGHIQYAIGLEPLTDLDIEAGRFKEADQNIEQMLQIFDSAGYKRRVYDLEYSRVLETSARYYAIMGLFDRARELLNRAERLNSRSAEAISNSSTIDELAYLYIRTEQYTKTERLLLDAVEVRKERYGEDSRFLITPYNQLARLAYIQGDFVQAEDLADNALKIAIETFGENALQTTESHTIKADIYSAIGDYDKAETEAQFVIDLEQKLFGDKHVELANSLTQLALIKFFAQENFESVETLLIRAKEIISLDLGEDNPVYAASLKNLALVYSEKEEKWAEAYQLLLEANQIWIAKLGTEENTNSSAIELLLGDIELKRGQTEGAIGHYAKAQKTYSRIFNKNHPEYVRSTSKLGRAYYVKQDYKKSKKYTEEALDNYLGYINEFFPALSEREKARYWQKIRNDFEFYTSLAIKYEKGSGLLGRVYDNTLSTKALLLSSSIKIRDRILNSGDSALVSSYNEWKGKKEYLTKVLAMSTEQQKEEGVEPNKLEKEIEDLEKSLSEQSDVFSAAKGEEVTWKDVKNSLASDEAAIEIIRYRHFERSFTDSVLYAAFIVTPKTRTEPKVVVLNNGNELETKLLGYYRTCIQFEIDDERSFANYWAPISKELPGNTKVYLSAEGVYNQINLEAMPDTSGSYIIDKSNIALVSNTKELTNSQVEQSEASFEGVSLFGNPVFYKDLPENEFNKYTARQVSQLPGTLIEVQKLSSLIQDDASIKTETYVNLEATEGKVKALSSPSVFHIATHGFFLEDETAKSENSLEDEQVVTNPLLRSGLLLRNAGDLIADQNVYAFNKEEGVLTAYEAMNLNLDNTKLVVLSACETGRGDNKVGEGVYGLQRAFLVAGAESIIMSLFEVSDDATQKLMVYFYENWLEKKMQIRDAFIEAKKQLREEYNEPKYWGAFIMVGAA